ncbi:MAG TPA: CD225/dispanin family protein [bacterium]|nr:CD225/dispanin family protein [bacterium]
MFCQKCGFRIIGDANFCPSCGSQLHTYKGATFTEPPQQPENQAPEIVPTAPEPAAPALDIPDYLSQAAIITVVSFFCCNFIAFIVGLISVLFASSSRSRRDAGDFQSAADAANTAKILFYIALALFILGIVAAGLTGLFRFPFMNHHHVFRNVI